MKVDLCKRWIEVPNEAMPIIRALYPYSGWSNPNLTQALTHFFWDFTRRVQNYQVLALGQADNTGNEWGVVLMRPNPQSRWYITAFYCNDDPPGRAVSRMYRMLLPLRLRIGTMQDVRTAVSFMMICTTLVSAAVSISITLSPYASPFFLWFGVAMVVVTAAFTPLVLMVRKHGLGVEPKASELRWLHDLVKAKG